MCSETSAGRGAPSLAAFAFLPGRFGASAQYPGEKNDNKATAKPSFFPSDQLGAGAVPAPLNS